MDKRGVINEIIELQQHLSKAIIPYAINTWRELNVPLAQLKSLLIISSKNDINSHALAENLGVTPGNITRIIESLVEQGLVVRKQNTEDRRVIYLTATDKGKELIASLMESQMHRTFQILDYMSLDELNALSIGMTGIIRAVEEHAKEFI